MTDEKNIYKRSKEVEDILKWCLENPSHYLARIERSPASEWAKDHKKILWWWRNHPRPVVPLDENDPARRALAQRLKDKADYAAFTCRFYFSYHDDHRTLRTSVGASTSPLCQPHPPRSEGSHFWLDRENDLKRIARNRKVDKEVLNWPLDGAGYPIPRDLEPSIALPRPSSSSLSAIEVTLSKPEEPEPAPTPTEKKERITYNMKTIGRLLPHGDGDEKDKWPASPA